MIFPVPYISHNLNKLNQEILGSLVRVVNSGMMGPLQKQFNFNASENLLVEW